MKISIDQIDQLLPQTQCGLCEYKGCRPYATAIVEQGERIDKCLPGGVRVLRELGALTKINTESMVDEMSIKTKPPMLAVIREAECIGCTKCIQACPVDAIIGASKQMHTILTDICNGCELCIEPCPVDCIDLIVIPEPNATTREQNAKLWRQRYEKREQRLERLEKEKVAEYQQSKLGENSHETLDARRKAITDAVARAKAKRDV